jgi:hypothetical protein
LQKVQRRNGYQHQSLQVWQTARFQQQRQAQTKQHANIVKKEPEAAAEYPDGAGDADNLQGANPDMAADVHEENSVPKQPVKLGYRTFQSGSEAAKYIKNILALSRLDQPLNEVSLLLVGFLA